MRAVGVDGRSTPRPLQGRSTAGSDGRSPRPRRDRRALDLSLGTRAFGLAFMTFIDILSMSGLIPARRRRAASRRRARAGLAPMAFMRSRSSGDAFSTSPSIWLICSGVKFLSASAACGRRFEAATPFRPISKRRGVERGRRPPSPLGPPPASSPRGSCRLRARRRRDGGPTPSDGRSPGPRIRAPIRRLNPRRESNRRPAASLVDFRTARGAPTTRRLRRGRRPGRGGSMRADVRARDVGARRARGVGAKAMVAASAAQAQRRRMAVRPGWASPHSGVSATGVDRR